VQDSRTFAVLSERFFIITFLGVCSYSFIFDYLLLE